MTMRLLWIGVALLSRSSFAGAGDGEIVHNNGDNNDTQRTGGESTRHRRTGRIQDIVHSIDNFASDMADKIDGTRTNNTTEGSSESSEEITSDSQAATNDVNDTATQDSQDSANEQSGEEDATEDTQPTATDETADDSDDSSKKEISGDEEATEDKQPKATDETALDSDDSGKKEISDKDEDESSPGFDEFRDDGVLIGVWIFFLSMCVTACVWLAGRELCCRGGEVSRGSKENDSTAITVPYV